MARAVGVDIGHRSIKVVELSGGPKAFRVQRMAIREVPQAPGVVAEGETAPTPDERVAEVVRELFDSLKLPKEDVCATFSAGDTLTREITVPFRDDDQIRKVAKFEAENHLHSHSVDEVVVNWIKTGETRDGSRLIILASPKDELEKRLAVLRRAGIEPASVDLDVTALFTACDAAGLFVQRPNVILMDVGARTTNLLLVSGGRPRMMRTFLAGVESLPAATEEVRRKAKIPAGSHPDDLLVPVLEEETDTAEGAKALTEAPGVDRRMEVLKKLSGEAWRSTAAVRVDEPPEVILLSGGGALEPGVAESLGERFGLPVEVLDLGAKVGWRDLGAEPEVAKALLAPAIGCGLRMLGHNPLGVELLKEEFSPSNVFDVVKTALATGVALLFLVVLGLTFAARKQLEAEQKRYNQSLAAAKSIFRVPEKAYLQAVKAKTEPVAEQEVNAWLDRGIPQDHTRIDQIRKQLLKRYRELETQLGLAKDVTPVRSGVQVWFELYKALSSVPREELSKGYFRVNKLDITERQASITIEVDDVAVLDKVTALFEKSEYFRERAKKQNEIVQKGGVSPTRDGHSVMEYTLQFKDDE